MINRFKIWFNRNNYKIMATIFVILIVYVAIKGLNNYFKNSYENEKTSQLEPKTDIYDNLDGEYLFEDKKDIETYKKLDKDDEEYNTVQDIFSNILNKVSKARANNDSKLKSELYNICADFFLDEMTSSKKEPDEDNILDYYLGVEESNINKYYIGEVYKYYQNNDVKGYIVETRYDMGNEQYENGFMVIYVDYENKTFLYGGGYASLDNINSTIDQESIEKIDGNSFG